MATSQASRVRRRPDLVFRLMDDEAWVLATRDQSLHRLNPTAAHLWAMLDDEPTVESMGTSLAAHFEVESGTATQDVDTFVRQLSDLGLVELVGPR